MSKNRINWKVQLTRVNRVREKFAEYLRTLETLIDVQIELENQGAQFPVLKPTKRRLTACVTNIERIVNGLDLSGDQQEIK